VSDRRPKRATIARWIFFRRDNPKPSRKEVLVAFGILVGVALVNTTCQELGAYERLEWADLDRLQRTAPLTESKGISLILINDKAYEEIFAATSPLQRDSLTSLIAAVCRFKPRVVGVDILTADWPPGYYANVVAPRLGNCPIVWIIDAVSKGNDTLRLGKILGAGLPPRNACVAAPMLEEDADLVIRRYRRWYFVNNGQNGAIPGFGYALARHAASGACPTIDSTLGQTRVDPPRIRFTSHDDFTRYDVRLVMQAGDTAHEQHWVMVDRLRDRIVVLGGAFRHSRDKHATPNGELYGAEVLASTVYTEMAAPIVDVKWWWSLLLDIVVGMLLLVALHRSGLRWPWATLSSVVLSVIAALVIAWTLHKYLGFFLSVLGGLLGVVLAELVSVLWKPLSDMWQAWLREYPTERDAP
jgi:CHASE2 domain-containing sensor protein